MGWCCLMFAGVDHCFLTRSGVTVTEPVWVGPDEKKGKATRDDNNGGRGQDGQRKE